MAHLTHSWDLSPQAAVALQQQLAGQIVTEVQFKAVRTVAGIDVSIRDDLGRAAVVVFSYPELEIVAHSMATRTITLPYIPGLLSFREGPVVLEALGKLSPAPDLLIFDAQGIAHPRRLGLASHIGLITDLPAIGCAKSRLCGHYQEPAPERGSYAWLSDQGETIGAAVRTRAKVKPVFVSIGHRIDLPTSIAYVLNTCRGYRLPEPTRRAHQAAGGNLPSFFL